MTKPYLSIVIPVYNEQENLENLVNRIYETVTKMAKPFEVIFVNDGSKDNSLSILLEKQKDKPEVKIVDFNGNFGQHMAILAGFQKS